MESEQQAQERQRALNRELKLAREHLSDLAWELEELERRLKPLEEQLKKEGQGDQLVSREVEQLRRQRAEMEEQIIHQMLLLDDLNAQQSTQEAS